MTVTLTVAGQSGMTTSKMTLKAFTVSIVTAADSTMKGTLQQVSEKEEFRIKKQAFASLCVSRAGFHRYNTDLEPFLSSLHT